MPSTGITSALTCRSSRPSPACSAPRRGQITSAVDGGEQTYYRVTHLYFADQAALSAAFGSDEGKATAADYQQIAPPGSRMFVETLDD